MFYVRNACPYQQSFTKDLRMRWAENDGILRAVRCVKIVRIWSFSGLHFPTFGIRTVFIHGEKMSLLVLSAHLSTFYLRPLLFTCLLNKEIDPDSIKYIITNPNLMKKGIYLLRAT